MTQPVHQNNDPQGASLPVMVFACAVLIWGAQKLPNPLHVSGEIMVLSYVVHFLAIVVVFRTFIRVLENIAAVLDWMRHTRTTGKGGTSDWMDFKDIKYCVGRNANMPFWGAAWEAKKVLPLFFSFNSNALTIAPAGSGKGISSVVPNILAIRDSKVVMDFKGELSVMLKDTLEKRGEIVRIINAGHLFGDILGESDRYNPLDLIADSLAREGGLRDVPADLQDMCKQILPEAKSGKHANTYFEDGSRDLVEFSILIETMIELHGATLSSVALLIENRTRLEDMSRWLVGVDVEGNPHPDGAFPIENTEWAHNHDPQDVTEFAELTRAKAHNILDLISGNDRKTFDSFITGAQQALRSYAFGRLAPALSNSTFKMSDLKEGDRPTTLFIVVDASRIEAYKKPIGLLQYCCMTEIKRHENKSRPVYYILDEATNYKIHGLSDLLTWGRGYGLRLHLIFQDLSAFERVYGKEALETLLSETEIKQFLPHQRSPKTLELISKILGNQSIKVEGVNYQSAQQGHGQNLSEEGRPLATSDEIRRLTWGILIVRQLRPILFDPVSYAEITPWKKQVGINPFHGKPFIKKTKLKL